MEVTESLLDRVPVGNLRVPRAEFGALWVAAERLNAEQTGRPDPDWYPAALPLPASGWLAPWFRTRRAVVTLAPSPVTRRRARAYEELIEAEYLAAEQLDVRRPDLMQHQPGWCEGIRATCGGRGGTRVVARRRRPSAADRASARVTGWARWCRTRGRLCRPPVRRW